MSFFVELWESVFTPGTLPALMKATHASFVLLLLSLLTLVYLTRSIHYINLLVIALLLYASVIWFVSELQSAKLKNNEELIAAAEKEAAEKVTEDESEAKTTATKAAPVRKRKV